jgi:hypothetical protein
MTYELAIEEATIADVDQVLRFWAGSDAVPSSTDSTAALGRLLTDFGGLLLARRPQLVGTLIATRDGCAETCTGWSCTSRPAGTAWRLPWWPPASDGSARWAASGSQPWSP